VSCKHVKQASGPAVEPSEVVEPSSADAGWPSEVLIEIASATEGVARAVKWSSSSLADWNDRLKHVCEGAKHLSIRSV